MKRHGLLLLAGLCAACADLPDMGRGQHALENGDVATAEENFKPLAELGYADAQLKLARIYSQQATPEALQEAATWYRAAMVDDPAQAVPLARVLLRLNTPQSIAEAEALLNNADTEGDLRSAIYLVELYTDYPQRDKEGRVRPLIERISRLNESEAHAAVVRWYRKNSADPKYAAMLLERCSDARKRLPECYVDLARHYRNADDSKKLLAVSDEALASYRNGALSAPLLMRVGWILVSDEYAGSPHPEKAHALLKLTADDSALGQVRLARLLIEYPQLDANAKPEKLLLKAAEKGFPEADLALGRMYMKGQTVPVDPEKAERYFKKVAATLPSANYYLGRMYKKGELGRNDPVLAVRYLLTAARQGYPQADLALAQLYSDNRGVRANLANAYAFASLAASNAVPNGAETAAQIKAQMKAEDLKRAQRVLAQEASLRQSPATAEVATRMSDTGAGQ